MLLLLLGGSGGSSGFAWAAAEAALAAWIAAATGAPVVWAYQNQPRQARPLVVLTPSEIEPVGREAEEQEYGAAMPVGSELLITVRQRWKLAVQATVLCAPAAVLGNSSPHALLIRALTVLRTKDAGDDLAAAGLGLIGFSPVRFDPQIFQGDWQPAATSEIYLDMTETAAGQRIGHITGVRLVGSDPASTLTIDATVNPEEP